MLQSGLQTGSISSIIPGGRNVVLRPGNHQPEPWTKPEKRKIHKVDRGETINHSPDVAQEHQPHWALTHAPKEYPARSIDVVPSCLKYATAVLTSSCSPVPSLYVPPLLPTTAKIEPQRRIPPFPCRTAPLIQPRYCSWTRHTGDVGASQPPPFSP